jgi:hypothetical protein
MSKVPDTFGAAGLPSGAARCRLPRCPLAQADNGGDAGFRTPPPEPGVWHARHYFLPDFSPAGALESAAMKASWGTSTRPTIFIRFLPSFCFSSSLRLRVMSPP